MSEKKKPFMEIDFEKEIEILNKEHGTHIDLVELRRQIYRDDSEDMTKATPLKVNIVGPEVKEERLESFRRRMLAQAGLGTICREAIMRLQVPDYLGQGRFSAPREDAELPIGHKFGTDLYDVEEAYLRPPLHADTGLLSLPQSEKALFLADLEMKLLTEEDKDPETAADFTRTLGDYATDLGYQSIAQEFYRTASRLYHAAAEKCDDQKQSVAYLRQASECNLKTFKDSDASCKWCAEETGISPDTFEKVVKISQEDMKNIIENPPRGTPLTAEESLNYKKK